MSQTTQLSNDSTTGPSIGLSSLERAWEVQWALRLACGVLFLDIALLLSTRQGLMTWTAHSEGMLQDLAFLAVALSAFALLMSLVLPLMAAVLRWIGWGLVALLPSALLTQTEQRGRPLGYVSERDLLELALRENNDFLLGWHRHHVARRESSETFMQTLGDLVFGGLILAILNGLLPTIATVETFLVSTAISALEDHAVPIILCVLLSGCALLKRAWFPSYATQWIYYPPLDLALREKVRIARERQ